MEIPLSVGDAWNQIGVWPAGIIFSSLNGLFAVCAAVMDILRCIVLDLPGKLGPGGVNVTWKWEWEEVAAGSYSAECVSSNLHSRLLMEKTLVQKKLVTLKQESKEVQVDWAIIQQYLIDLNLNGKDEQEKSSNFQNQQNQVSDTAAEQEVAPAQEESLLQTVLSPQEPPAELQPPTATEFLG